MQKHISILILILFFITSCTPSRQIKEKENSILLSEHGYIILDFNYYKYIDHWACKFIVNDEEYFYGTFGNHYFDQNDKKIYKKDDFEYKFPVPVGDLKIEYILHAKTGQADTYGTSQNPQIGSIRTLHLKIKQDETIKLKLNDSKAIEKTIACIPGCIFPPIVPWPGTFQEVTFVIDK